MKWIFSPLESEKIKEIQDNLDLPTQVVNILLQRKINKPRLIKDFLSLDLSLLHDPFLMKGMDIAVESQYHISLTEELMDMVFLKEQLKKQQVLAQIYSLRVTAALMNPL